MTLSKDSILKKIKKKTGRPMKVSELARALGINEVQRRDFRNKIKLLAEEGTLVRLRGGRYGLPDEMNLVTGFFYGHPNGYGFLTPDTGEEKGDIYIDEVMPIIEEKFGTWKSGEAPSPLNIEEDPFNGREDLSKRILRHVSEAFKEDPLRVLRIARFRAKLFNFGFNIADETKELVVKIVASGELSSLVPERVWIETEKALNESRFDQYFKTLIEFGAFDQIYPDLSGINEDFFSQSIFQEASKEKISSRYRFLKSLNSVVCFVLFFTNLQTSKMLHKLENP